MYYFTDSILRMMEENFPNCIIIKLYIVQSILEFQIVLFNFCFIFNTIYMIYNIYPSYAEHLNNIDQQFHHCISIKLCILCNQMHS
jgi:hypothetical protein